MVHQVHIIESLCQLTRPTDLAIMTEPFFARLRRVLLGRLFESPRFLRAIPAGLVTRVSLRLITGSSQAPGVPVRDARPIAGDITPPDRRLGIHRQRESLNEE